MKDFLDTIFILWKSLDGTNKFVFILALVIVAIVSIWLTYLILTKVLHFNNDLKSQTRSLKHQISKLKKDNVLLKKQIKKYDKEKTMYALKADDAKDEALDKYFVNKK